MVKVNDPRTDYSAIAMRSLRADTVSKCIKSIIKKSKVINTNKIKDRLDKLDNYFSEEFNNCSDIIKQELIFLWEEVGDLNKLIEEYENNNLTEDNKEHDISCPVSEEVPVPKKMRLFGP